MILDDGMLKGGRKRGQIINMSLKTRRKPNVFKQNIYISISISILYLKDGPFLGISSL